MKYSVNTANNFGIIIKDTKRMPIIPIDNFLNDFRYTVTCNQYKSEIKCALSPFSFFKDRNYTLFRIMYKRVYKIQFSGDQKYNDETEAATNTILYIEFINKLKDELYMESNSNKQIKDIYDRIPAIEEYLTNKDKSLVDVGISLIRNFVQQIEKELGYDND